MCGGGVVHCIFGPRPNPNPSSHYTTLSCKIIFLPCTIFSFQDELEKEVERSKTVNLELVFGYHWKPGTGRSVRLVCSETHTQIASTYSAAVSI